MTAPLVSIIGPPASGKTTLAKLLAEELHARLILEDYQGNPFLSGSFLGQSELALPAQLYFLFSRLGQLARASWPGEGACVSDYGFCQDALYAARRLGGGDLAVYNRLSAQAQRLVTCPRLVIHLDGPEELLLERIARRGREYETAFTAEFLGWMRNRYRQVIGELSCPVLDVDVSQVDLRQDAQRQRLFGQVREILA